MEPFISENRLLIFPDPGRDAYFKVFISATFKEEEYV